MAQQLLETEYGAALLADALQKRYWTIDDRKLVSMLLNPEPWPHMVYYREGHAIYLKPDMFCMRPSRSPSDCEWIVPGTGQVPGRG